MPKDYASRGRSKPKSRPKNARKSPRAQQRVLFHGPSFAAGVVVGAAIVILAIYAPQMIDSGASEPDPSSAPPQARPEVIFEFQDRLKNTVVNPDPEPYAVPESEVTESAALLIQAASFRDPEDADRLRADLLLQNLPAQTVTFTADGVTWHRVVVGPFERKVEADRAMTRLRQRGLSAIWTNDHN